MTNWQRGRGWFEDFDTTGEIYERMAVVSDVIQPVYDEINKKYGLDEKQE